MNDQNNTPAAPDWVECERISNLPLVDEALRNFADDQTADNATGIIKAAFEAYTPAAPVVDKEALRTEIQLRGHIHMLNDEIEGLKERAAAPVVAEGLTTSDADKAMWSLQEFYQHDTKALEAIAECRAILATLPVAGSPASEAAREWGFVEALAVAQGVFGQYKVDQPKWWRKMDGTPILNDVEVRMAEAFKNVAASLPAGTGITRTPSRCAGCGALLGEAHVPGCRFAEST